jgi:hypothetical protein
MDEADAGAGAEPHEPPQGWYVDPYGIHHHRWISQRRPTALVRDGQVESQDPPPDHPMPDGPLVPGSLGPDLPHASDDLLRTGDRLGEPTLDPQNQFDFFGHPALPGTIGVPTRSMDADGRIRSPWGNAGFGPPRRARRGSVPVDTPAVTSKRQLRLRWITLGGAAVWTALVVLEFFGATTTVTTPPGHHRTETVYASQPAAVLSFVAALVVCDLVTALDFVRRVRSESERWGVAGAVCVGVLALLGILSLATVGLSMLLLAFLLYVVARPIRRARPMPGERVAPTTPVEPSR